MTRRTIAEELMYARWAADDVPLLELWNGKTEISTCAEDMSISQMMV